jgi:hypothetical protein
MNVKTPYRTRPTQPKCRFRARRMQRYQAVNGDVDAATDARLVMELCTPQCFVAVAEEPQLQSVAARLWAIGHEVQLAAIVQRRRG